MRFFAVALACFGAAASFAQTPEVPHKMQFAGMVLTIRDDARREIQTDVDALTQHSRYFAMKVERAKTYFPLIEKIFAEEGVPEDFKYLVLQESALVADAVSVSNAVGFWQFKDFTAMEMGLRVDRNIDERMNLVSATRGAARYLKQNNYRFNNWLLALQSYQMGAGGVMRAMGDGLNGAKHMEITSETYWYVKKFLAHKVTFENNLSGEAQLKVIAYQPKKGKTLKEIANELSAQEEDLREYNKWLKTSEIPDDKIYTVLVPVGKHDQDFTKLILSSSKASKAKPIEAIDENESAKTFGTINSIPVIFARPGEKIAALAERGKIDISSFLKYNDIAIDHTVELGTPYLLGKKKGTGAQEFYKTKPGDDLWTVSQRFGVRLKKLRKYNRITDDQALEINSLVWLQGDKPKPGPVLLVAEDVATLENDTFDWYTKSPKSTPVSGVPFPKQVTAQPDSDSISVLVNNSFNDQIDSEPRLKPTQHIVRPGDTFYSIARQYGIEVSNLLAWNDLTIQSGLRPSQMLKVVENDQVRREEYESAQQGPMVHEVTSTDTLFSIARQYGVTIKDIMDWNRKKDFSVSMGEKLEIRRK